MMKLYRTSAGAMLADSERCLAIPDAWDDLLARGDLPAYLSSLISSGGLHQAKLPAQPLGT